MGRQESARRDERSAFQRLSAAETKSVVWCLVLTDRSSESSIVSGSMAHGRRNDVATPMPLPHATAYTTHTPTSATTYPKPPTKPHTLSFQQSATEASRMMVRSGRYLVGDEVECEGEGEIRRQPGKVQRSLLHQVAPCHKVVEPDEEDDR